ncbi:MAG: hypothetical protein ACFFDS_08880 [Candidatus Thorarchaeota archaeon]
MSFWRFKAILKTLEKKLCIESGKPYIEQGLSRSAKDMIERRKKQRPGRKNGTK